MKRRLAKELKSLYSDCPDGITIMQHQNESTIFDVTIIGPDNTAYKDGKFKLLMKLPSEYPFKPPKIKFLTPVYHPKVNPKNGKISLDILRGNWSPAMTIIMTCIAIQSMFQESGGNDISQRDSLNKSAAILWKKDFESAKIEIKKWVIKYANNEYNASMSDIEEQTNNKQITNLICENCGASSGDISECSLDSESNKKHEFGLFYSDNVKIEIEALKCIDCGWLLPKIMNAGDTNYRNDDIKKIIRSLPLPQDVVMIIMKYWLQSLIGKNVYCIWSGFENYGAEHTDYLGPYLLAAKIKSIDLNEIFDNTLLIELDYINRAMIASDVNMELDTVKVDLFNNNGDILNNNYNKCWVTSIVSNLITTKYDNTNYSQQIFVKTLTGKTITINVDVSKHRVLDVKMFIFYKEGIPPRHQRLIYGFKELKNHKLLCDCDCYNERTLHLVLRLPGGY